MTARSSPLPRAFTLVELLVSMAIMAVLLLLLLKMTNSTSFIWRNTSSRIEEFRNARNGFETITRRLSQATLNTYWGYNANPPTAYLRQSELRFVSGPMQTSGTYPGLSSSTNARPTDGVFFQAPLGFVSNDPGSSTNATTSYAGLDNLLNTVGYYVEFGSDATLRPAFLNSLARPPAYKYRYRLKELMESSQDLSIYAYTSGYATSGTALNCTVYSSANPASNPNSENGLEWFRNSLALTGSATRTQVLADNIIALVILPKLAPADEQAAITSGTLTGALGTNLAPNYIYDTTATNANTLIDPKNQLPPVVQVTMVALDEASYSRFQGTSATAPTLVPSTYFVTAGDLVNPANAGFAQDMQNLQKTLVANRLNFRVFSTDVVMKTAKWSRSETK